MTAAAALARAALLAAASTALVPVPEVPLDGLDPAVARPLADARARLDHALRDGQPSAAVFADAARLYHAYGMLAAATAAYRDAATLAPGDFRWPYLLAVARQEAGDLEGASDALERALAAGDPYYPAVLRMASVQLARGRLEEASRWLAIGRGHAPRDPALLGLEGELALARRRLRLAAGQIGRAHV